MVLSLVLLILYRNTVLPMMKRSNAGDEVKDWGENLLRASLAHLFVCRMRTYIQQHAMGTLSEKQAN
jgi:hypothetical protein